MKSFCSWIARAMGDGENPSALRLVMVPGALLAIATACFLVCWSICTKTPVPDVPFGTSAFFLSILSTVLGAKIWQANIENRNPPTGGAA